MDPGAQLSGERVGTEEVGDDDEDEEEGPEADESVPIDLSGAWLDLPLPPHAPGPFVAADPGKDGGFGAFSEHIAQYDVVLVNFYAPWCYWSQQLAPAWDEAARRLASRSYRTRVAMVKVDCASSNGRFLCMRAAVHAFPSVRIYHHGALESYEPYDEPRTVEAIWRVVVARACDSLAHAVREHEADGLEVADPAARHMRHALHQAAGDLGRVLRLVNAGAYAHLEREDLLDEATDMRLLRQRLTTAIYSVARSKMTSPGLAADEGAPASASAQEALKMALEGEGSAGATAAEHGYKYLTRMLESYGVAAYGADAVDDDIGSRIVEDLVEGPAEDAADGAGQRLPKWLQPSAAVRSAEGCVVIGHVQVARVPGQLRLAPHSGDMSFDFSAVNTSHHVDYLSFGDPGLARKVDTALPADVAAHLAPLSATAHVADEVGTPCLVSRGVQELTVPGRAPNRAGAPLLRALCQGDADHLHAARRHGLGPTRARAPVCGNHPRPPQGTRAFHPHHLRRVPPPPEHQGGSVAHRARALAPHSPHPPLPACRPPLRRRKRRCQRFCSTRAPSLAEWLR